MYESHLHHRRLDQGPGESMRAHAWMAVFRVFLALPLLAFAADQSTRPSALDTQYEIEEIEKSTLRIQRMKLDEAELVAIREFKSAERRAVLEEYRLRQKLYDRQLVYHPIVLGTVIAIVIAGIIFCGFQVWRDIHTHSGAATTFKIGRDGVELSSSVVGLISLGLSFLFFYLYVTTIYHITEASKDAPHAAVPAAVQPTESKQ